jgi:hypothetical protein
MTRGAPTVAIAACRMTDASPPDELYPDPDGAVLRPAFLAAGAASAELVSWDDERVDWSSFDVVCISSTWDSVDRPAEYLAWVASVPHVQNPPAVVAWNLDKVYLRDLDEAGLPIVPTTWVAPGDPVPALPPGDVVVKPAVSAGGRSTAWYSTAAHDQARDHIASLQQRGATVMVQDHIAGVAVVGEVKAVFLDGRYSHAARVGGLLDRDAGTMERPWEKPVPIVAADASMEERAVGDAVVAELARRFGQAPPYARVDLVHDAVGRPRILEVELIDPSLFLAQAPGSAERLAGAVLSSAASRR